MNDISHFVETNNLRGYLCYKAIFWDKAALDV